MTSWRGPFSKVRVYRYSPVPVFQITTEILNNLLAAISEVCVRKFVTLVLSLTRSVAVAVFRVGSGLHSRCVGRLQTWK